MCYETDVEHYLNTSTLSLYYSGSATIVHLVISDKFDVHRQLFHLNLHRKKCFNAVRSAQTRNCPRFHEGKDSV
jgi:hypothetical protein